MTMTAQDSLLDMLIDRAAARGARAGSVAGEEYLDPRFQRLRGSAYPTAEDCPSPLSGEWAGESIPELLGDLIDESEGLVGSGDDLDDASDAICDAYEAAFEKAWMQATGLG